MQDLDSLTAALRASADRFGPKPCLISPARSVSFALFARHVAAIAEGFRGLGIGSGDRVALLDVDSIEYLECLFALAAIGAIAVPLNYRQRSAELQYQVENAGARLLLVSRRYAAEATVLGHGLALGSLPMEAFAAEAIAAGETGTLELQGVDGRTPYAICYTSGTTGRPKGAVLEQRAACLRAMRLMLECGMRPSDVVHVTTPMFHISALNMSLMAIMRGCTILVLPQFELATTMRAMRQYGVTFVALVPTMLALMRQSPDFAPGCFGSIRLILYAGAPMNPQLLRDVRSVYDGEFVQSFGQTEDLPQSILTAEDHREAFASGSPRLGSVGRPPIGVELSIRDAHGRTVEPGEIGEIVSRGGTAMRGYWNLPRETAETIRDGWVYSGDLGYRDADGFLYLAGRKRQMIIRGGENVYPAEVERVLLSFPGIIDAAVIGIPDPVWGEIVAAAVVAESPLPTPDAVILHCKTLLASYRCPERVTFHSQLPYNASGKVDRAVLRQQIESREREP